VWVVVAMEVMLPMLLIIMLMRIKAGMRTPERRI
jgi:hypothetical protein